MTMAFNNRKQASHVEIMEKWSDYFDLRNVRGKDAHRIDFLGNSLVVTRDHIKTASLTKTVTFYRTIMRSHDIAVLPGCPEHLNDVLDVFARLATFDNLTRAKFAPTRPPIFRTEMKQTMSHGMMQRGSVPVVPYDTAAAMCGLDKNRLRTNIESLYRDGAIGETCSEEGIRGIYVREGFIVDNGFRKYYRA